jgi:hypothetical protein
MQHFKSSEFTFKVNTVANMLKLEFSDTRIDLAPMLEESYTLKQSYIDSIHIAMHFPGQSIPCQCNTILIHIRFYIHPSYEKPYFIGVDAVGYDGFVQLWMYSSVNCSQFRGIKQPITSGQEKLKRIFDKIFRIFADTHHNNLTLRQ